MKSGIFDSLASLASYYSPEWMIQPVSKPSAKPTATLKAPTQQSEERSIRVHERRMRVDRRRVERRHKR